MPFYWAILQWISIKVVAKLTNQCFSIVFIINFTYFCIPIRRQFKIGNRLIIVPMYHQTMYNIVLHNPSSYLNGLFLSMQLNTNHRKYYFVCWAVIYRSYYSTYHIMMKLFNSNVNASLIRRINKISYNSIYL